MAQRGILGYKKDPKNPILFSFTPREGDECPSDSDDSDYVPPTPIHSVRKVPPLLDTGNVVNQIKNGDSNDTESIASDEQNPVLVPGFQSPNPPLILGTSDQLSTDVCGSNPPGEYAQNGNHAQGDNSYAIITKVKKRKKHKKKSRLSEQDEHRSRKKRKIKKLKISTRYLDNSMNNLFRVTQPLVPSNVSMDGFPLHIIIQIFTYIVDMHGAVPFLCRVAGRVCRRWHVATLDPRLWRKVDLSYGWIKSSEEHLEWLCEHRLYQCWSLDLTSWQKLTNSGVVTLSEKCTELRHINLSRCTNVASRGIQAIADNCAHLRNINVTSINCDGMSNASLKYLLEKRGVSLTHFISGGFIRSCNTLLSSICTNCANLQHLEVNNVILTEHNIINIERLQHACPLMRVLRFVNMWVRFQPATALVQAKSPGFPCLEELSVTSTSDKSVMRTSLDGDAISRLLKTSSNLHTLDVRGWAFDTFRPLIHVPATSLQILFLGNNTNTVTDDFHLDLVMAKWGDSLQEVDLSSINYHETALTSAMDALTERGQNLQVLDLSRTVVNYDDVKKIVKCCCKLRSLNLSSCRSLPRGMKREYEGDSMQWLRDNIHTFSAT